MPTEKQPIPTQKLADQPVVIVDILSSSPRFSELTSRLSPHDARTVRVVLNDPRALRVRTIFNGRTRADGSTDEMGVHELMRVLEESDKIPRKFNGVLAKVVAVEAAIDRQVGEILSSEKMGGVINQDELNSLLEQLAVILMFEDWLKQAAAEKKAKASPRKSQQVEANGARNTNNSAAESEDILNHELVQKLKNVTSYLAERMRDTDYDPRSEPKKIRELTAALKNVDTLIGVAKSKASTLAQAIELESSTKKQGELLLESIYERAKDLDDKAYQDWEPITASSNLIVLVNKIISRLESTSSQSGIIRLTKSLKIRLGSLLERINEVKTRADQLEIDAKAEGLDLEKLFFLKDRQVAFYSERIQAAEASLLKAEPQMGKDIEDLTSRLQQKLLSLSNKTEFINDGVTNELNTEYEIPILATLGDLEREGLSRTEFQRLKEGAVDALYKAYRRSLIKQLEYIEDKNTTAKWEVVLEQNMLNRMKNLVEFLSGASIESVAELESRLKHQSAEKPSAHGSSIGAGYQLGLRPEYRKYIDDFKNVQEEYTARKFLHLSWAHVSPHALGANVRDYVSVTPDECPVVYTADYLIRDGLRSEEFGNKTNEKIEVSRKATIRPYSSPDGEHQGPDLNYDATVTGEVFRTLDRWSRGLVTLTLGKDTEPITTSNIQTSLEEVVEALHTRFERLEKGRGLDESRFSKNEIRRAFQAWVLLTYHESARAITSAKGSDSIYYRHQFALYNAGYAEDIKLDWEPTLTYLLFTFEDPITKEKFNPLPEIFGDTEEQRAVEGFMGSIIRALTGSTPALERIKHALSKDKNKGFIDPDMENKNVQKTVAQRLKNHGFTSYEFLLSPLLTCINVANGKYYKEEWSKEPGQENTLVRKYLLLKEIAPNKWEDVVVADKAEADDDIETPTLNPVLGYVFLKGPNSGHTMRFDTPRGPAKGRPVSFFDFRDELGNIVYEKLPFGKVASSHLEGVNSLTANAGTFLKDFLRNSGFVHAMEDPAKVGWFKNQGNYILRHLPNWGSYVAAGIHTERFDDENKTLCDESWRNVEKSLMSMLICTLVYAKLLIEVGSKKDKSFISAAEASAYLTKLIAKGAGIDEDNAEAIQIATIKAQEMSLRLEGITNKMTDRLRQRFRYSGGEK